MWRTIVEIVNIETGEIITKKEKEKENLKIIKKTIRYENTTRIVQWQCGRDEQTRIEYGADRKARDT